jgi:hypothetical protein
MPNRGTVCERVCRRENRDVALREQQPVVDGAGMSRASQSIAVLISPSSKSSMSFSAEPAQLDVKSGNELCDLRDRIEDERHRDGGGEADLQRRNLLALELLGSATRRLRPMWAQASGGLPSQGP